jgi:hypothetical protein
MNAEQEAERLIDIKLAAESVGIPSSVLKHLALNYDARPKDHDLPFSRAIYARHYGAIWLRALPFAVLLSILLMVAYNSLYCEISNFPETALGNILRYAFIGTGVIIALLVFSVVGGGNLFGDKTRQYIKDGCLVHQINEPNGEYGTKTRTLCCANIEKLEISLRHVHIIGDIIEMCDDYRSPNYRTKDNITLLRNFEGLEHLVAISREVCAEGQAIYERP